MNFNEAPKFEPSREQSTDLSKRSFMKKVVGAAAVVATGAALYKGLEENPYKESPKESLVSLLNEMDIKKLDAVPTIETTANEGMLSSAGWVRLEKIMKEHNMGSGSPDRKITIAELTQLLETVR
jgi:hypothetical protein